MNWSSKDRKPHLTFFNTNNKEKENFIVPSNWNLATTSTRHCTGYVSTTGHVLCPTNSVLEKSGASSSCESCMNAHAFACRATCRGIVCEPSSVRVREICFDIATTGVYLTLIGDIVKVGVSSNPMRRWLDQGSDYAVLVWKGNGLLARKIEHDIAAKLHLTMRVTFNQKLGALQKIKSPQDAKKILSELRTQIQRRFDFPNGKPYTMEFFNLLPYQKPQSLRRFRQIKPIYQPITKNTVVKGNQITFKGRMLVLERERSYYAYNFKQLWGWQLRDPKDLKGQSRSQQSLLSFVK